MYFFNVMSEFSGQPENLPTFSNFSYDSANTLKKKKASEQ